MSSGQVAIELEEEYRDSAPTFERPSTLAPTLTAFEAFPHSSDPASAEEPLLLASRPADALPAGAGREGNRPPREAPVHKLAWEPEEDAGVRLAGGRVPHEEETEAEPQRRPPPVYREW